MLGIEMLARLFPGFLIAAGTLLILGIVWEVMQ